MDWLTDLYGLFGAKRPVLSLCLVVVVGAIATGLFWTFLGFQWNKKNALSAGQQPSISAPNGNHNQNIQKNDGTATQINK